MGLSRTRQCTATVISQASQRATLDTTNTRRMVTLAGDEIAIVAIYPIISSAFTDNGGAPSAVLHVAL
jgi:hypothetical protein